MFTSVTNDKSSTSSHPPQPSQPVISRSSSTEQSTLESESQHLNTTTTTTNSSSLTSPQPPQPQSDPHLIQESAESIKLLTLSVSPNLNDSYAQAISNSVQQELSPVKTCNASVQTPPEEDLQNIITATPCPPPPPTTTRSSRSGTTARDLSIEIADPEPKMNGLSFNELCCLFCCPPCPGRIAAKLAFLPPDPTYNFVPNGDATRYTLMLSDRAEWQYSNREMENFEVFFTRTSRGNKLACLHVRACPNAKFTILFSHGNAVDLGQMSSFYMGLGMRLQCNIFSYDYSGYGISSGKPSEKNLYADIEAAWLALRQRYAISPDHILLYGQSIGTVPTVDLAARYEIGGVILHSPLMSGMRVAFPSTKRTWFFDAFPSIDKAPKVTCPVLVIHGTEDEVIDFSHGLAIYEKCPRTVDPLWVEGAGHNDVELFGQYLDRLKKFINTDLAHVASLPLPSSTTTTNNVNTISTSLTTTNDTSQAPPTSTTTTVTTLPPTSIGAAPPPPPPPAGGGVTANGAATTGSGVTAGASN